jgi:hypothetical protein
MAVFNCLSLERKSPAKAATSVTSNSHLPSRDLLIQKNWIAQAEGAREIAPDLEDYAFQNNRYPV